MTARYELYLLLGQDGPVDHPDRTAALDRMRAEGFRTAADIVEEFGAGAADELRRRAEGLEKGTLAAGEDESTPLVVRRVDTVIEPDRDSGETETVVGCIAEDGRPVALLLDDDERRKLARNLRLDEGDFPDRLALLVHHIRRTGGKWSSGRADQLYARLGVRFGSDVGRQDLAELARRGLLVKRGPQDGRFYTLPSRKDRDA